MQQIDHALTSAIDASDSRGLGHERPSATTAPIPPDVEAGGAGAISVAEYLSSFTYNWTTERELQEHVAGVLERRFPTQREHALSRRDRPDFIVEIYGLTIAVEVKVAGAHNAVLRQLGRYAEHDGIAAIVLASGKRTLLAGVPRLIHTKPIALALLAGAL